MGRRRKSRKDLPQRVYHRHGAYYFVDRTGKWHRLGKGYADAMIRYAEIQERPETAATLAQIIDRYQAKVLPAKAPKTQRDQLRQLGTLRDVFGHMRPHEVTAQHVYQYLDLRPRTAGQREKALLSHIYTCAIRWGAATENPCRGVAIERAARAPARYLTDAEIRAAKTHASKTVAAAIDLALLTGLRLGDLLRLRLQDCTGEGIKVQIGKTGAVVLYEWTDELRAAIERARGIERRAASLWIIATRDGQRYTESGWHAIWQRYQRKLEAEGLQRFRFHDLRRKAAADAEAAGGREYARQLLAHSSQQMTARYVGGIVRVRPLR